jgi:hypothetical protein
MSECRHIWKLIPTGEKCDSCGEQRAEQPRPPYIQPGVDAPKPPDLRGTSMGISENPTR